LRIWVIKATPTTHPSILQGKIYGSPIATSRRDTQKTIGEIRIRRKTKRKRKVTRGAVGMAKIAV
jgi:hypothetical protein